MRTLDIWASLSEEGTKKTLWINCKNCLHLLSPRNPQTNLFFSLKSESGFEQCGALFGQVIIENDSGEENEPKETLELNLPGLRKVILSDVPIDSTEELRFIGVGRDGSVLSLTNKKAVDLNQ